MNENPESNHVWEEKLIWFKSSSQYRTLDTLVGEPMEFEWNIFPRFTTLQLCSKVQEFMSKMSEEPEDFTGRIIFMSMFNDISLGSQDHEQECDANANLVSIYARRCLLGRWSFLLPGSEKEVVFYSWWQTTRRMGQSRWFDDDKIWRERTPSFKKQRVWEIINTLLRWWGSDWNCFSYNYFCLSAQHLRSSLRPIVWASKFVWENSYTFDRSIAKEPRTSGKALTTISCDKFLYWCRIPDNSWSRTVLHDERHWRILTIHRFSGLSVSTLCQEMKKSSDPKGWIRGNTKIGPVLKITTSYLQGKYGLEIRIESINKDNSHSWVKISHGLNKLVTDLSNNKKNDDNEQESSKMQFEDFAFENECTYFCEPIKG